MSVVPKSVPEIRREGGSRAGALPALLLWAQMSAKFLADSEIEEESEENEDYIPSEDWKKVNIQPTFHE